MAEGYTFKCSHCEAPNTMPDYFATLYAGHKVTRWCETCQQMFDVYVPPSSTPPDGGGKQKGV